MRAPLWRLMIVVAVMSAAVTTIPPAAASPLYVAPGAVRCDVSLTLRFNPPLTPTNSASRTTVRGTISTCSTSRSEVAISGGTLVGSFGSAPFACGSFDTLPASASAPAKLRAAWTGAVNGLSTPIVGTQLAFGGEDLEQGATGVGLSLVDAGSMANRSFGLNGSSLDFYSGATPSDVHGMCQSGVGLSQLSFTGFLDIGVFGVSFLDVHRRGPVDTTNGPDGALWFTDQNLRQVVRVAPTGAMTGYRLPYALAQRGDLPRPLRIVAGADGALWFTTTTRFVGRITTAGVMSFVDIPLSGETPTAIAAGPDGALWVTTTNHIARVTTDGVVSTYGDASVVLNASGITAGPDGALWFWDDDASLGRIATDGTISRVSTGGLRPTSVTAGADGALWFTTGTAPLIGRVTTDGVVSTYDVFINNPESITAGPDGALWFMGAETQLVGRITTDGAVSPPFGTAPLGPAGRMAPGPNNTLWFTGITGPTGHSYLGRIDVDIPQ